MTTERLACDRPPIARNLLTLIGAVAAIALLWSAALPAIDWRTFFDAPMTDLSVADQFATFVLRATATLMLGYLSLASALNLVAVTLGTVGDVTRIARWAAKLTPRWLAMASVSALAGGTMLVPAAGADPSGNGGTRTDVRLEVVRDAGVDDPAPRTMLPWAPGTGRTTVTAPPSTPTTTPTLPDPPRLTTVDPPAVGPDQLPPPLVIERSPAPAPGLDEHVVQPGEHFWSIAERVVSDRGIDVPVGQYWRLLVEANRSRLVDPDDPDLLYPGQVLVLP
jgi:nucleoid-associated protein YgaU